MVVAVIVPLPICASSFVIVPLPCCLSFPLVVVVVRLHRLWHLPYIRHHSARHPPHEQLLVRMGWGVCRPLSWGVLGDLCLVVLGVVPRFVMALRSLSLSYPIPCPCLRRCYCRCRLLSLYRSCRRRPLYPVLSCHRRHRHPRPLSPVVIIIPPAIHPTSSCSRGWGRVV